MTTCVFSRLVRSCAKSFFFFTGSATTEIYTLSLHDALPICERRLPSHVGGDGRHLCERLQPLRASLHRRSEEHTSELQSRGQLVCRLLLEKKKLGVIRNTP